MKRRRLSHKWRAQVYGWKHAGGVAVDDQSNQGLRVVGRLVQPTVATGHGADQGPRSPQPRTRPGPLWQPFVHRWRHHKARVAVDQAEVAPAPEVQTGMRSARAGSTAHLRVALSPTGCQQMTSVTNRPVDIIIRATAVDRRKQQQGANAMPPLDKVYDYSQYGGLRVEKQNKVMTITLNAPESMNAFSAEMHYSMSRIWEDVHDDPDVNVVVLTGAGRAFSAGGNLIAMQQKIDRPELWDATSLPEAKRIIFRMLECDKPIIARVNGHAVGLGATVALMCDIIIAADTAKIGDPHVNEGLGG